MTAPLSAADASARILEAEDAGMAVAEVVGIDGPAAGQRLLVYEDGRVLGSLGDEALDAHACRVAADLLAGGDTRLEELAGAGALFVAAHRPADRLVVVGAGHIAVPLAALGVRLGFEVTVVDDREEYATDERFPPQATVLRADFETDPLAGVRIDARTYVALVTRGHRWDFDCLRQLVAAEAMPRYVGMIGSRRRVRAALHALLEAGIPRDVLSTVRAPIGLEIGAETPEEIAVSIAAELVAVRRGTDVETMTSRERVLERLLPDGDEANG